MDGVQRSAAVAAWAVRASREAAKALAEEAKAAWAEAKALAEEAEALAEEAKAAWAMVLEYRSRCPANNRGPTGEAVAEAWGWLEASAGDWASADEAANDAGPSEADLRGEVDHG